MNYQGPPGSQRGIEWLQPPPPARGFTWNPGTGCGNTWCEVRPICWANRAAQRRGDDFTPKFHPERLMEPSRQKNPSLIALWLMGDGLSEGVDWSWLSRILTVIKNTPQHIYLWLTKNPQHLKTWALEDIPNLWVGTSISNGGDWCRERVYWLMERNQAVHRFLSIEPLSGPIDFKDFVDITGLEWIIIGGQSRPNVRPEWVWIHTLIEAAHQYHIPVLVKRNAHYAPVPPDEEALYRLAYATTVGPPPPPYELREWPCAILDHLKVKEVAPP